LKRKSLLTVLTGICLVLILAALPFMAACAAPTPTTKPITNIMIAAGRVGDSWYILSEALAYQINHKSDWLQATVVATPGITGDYELAMKDPGKYIFIGELGNQFYMTRDPYGKAYDYYDKARFIGTAASLSWLWVTYDSEIKTPQDFIGKTVDVGRKAAANTPDELAVLEEWGVLDKVKLAHSGFGGGRNSLKDGLVDIADMLYDHIYPAGISKGALITALETKGPIYYIGMDPDMIDKLRTEERFAGFAVRIPPGALDPKTQPKELYAASLAPFWAADERMDPDIVYEVTRILYESAGEFSTWHPQGAHLTKTFIPASPLDLKDTHPGAQKYYDEHGIEVVSLAELLR